MTKPIDWFKPLRVVGTQDEVKIVAIDPRDARPVRLASPRTKDDPLGQKWTGAVDRDGHGVVFHLRAGTVEFAVENIPPEPRIVERWAVHTRQDDYIGAYLHPTREAAEAKLRGYERHARIARVLIEEPEE